MENNWSKWVSHTIPHLWDKIPSTRNLKEARFTERHILAHSKVASNRDGMVERLPISWHPGNSIKGEARNGEISF